MATDLILKGALCLKPEGGAMTDVSSEVTGVIIKGTTNDVTIPATLSTGTSHAGGAQKYTIQIDYLSDDSSAGVLFPALWAAILTADKELQFQVTLRDGAKGPTNPLWCGTFVVSAADVGGDQEALSAGTLVCTMTGAPVIDAA